MSNCSGYKLDKPCTNPVCVDTGKAKQKFCSECAARFLVDASRFVEFIRTVPADSFAGWRDKLFAGYNDEKTKSNHAGDVRVN